MIYASFGCVEDFLGHLPKDGERERGLGLGLEREEKEERSGE